MDLSLDELLYRSSVVAKKAAQGNSLTAVYSALSTQPKVSPTHPLMVPPPTSLELTYASLLHSRGLSATLSESTRTALAMAGKEGGSLRAQSGSFHSPITARNPLLPHSPSLAAGGGRAKVAKGGQHNQHYQPHTRTAAVESGEGLKPPTLAMGGITTPPFSLSSRQHQRRGSTLGVPPHLSNRRGSTMGEDGAVLLSPASPDSRPSTLGHRPPSTPRVKYRLESSPSAELWYGSIVMLESLDGWFVTVNPSNGVVSVREPMDRAWEARRALPFLPPKRGSPTSHLTTPIFHFRVTHLTDPSRLNSRVKWGDPVWLVCVDSVNHGTGAAGGGQGADGDGGEKPQPPLPWKQGSVLGVQMLRGKGVVALSESEAFDALGGGLLGTEGEGAVNRRRMEVARRAAAAASEGAGQGVVVGGDPLQQQQQQQHPASEEGCVVEATTTSSSLQALRNFIAPAPHFKAGHHPTFHVKLPPPALHPVDPTDGIRLGSSDGGGGGGGGSGASPPPSKVQMPREGTDATLSLALELGRTGKAAKQDGGDEVYGVVSKTAMRDLFNNQQALAKFNSSAQGKVNLGVRVPLNRLGVIHPIPAYVPAFTSSSFSAQGSWEVGKGVLAMNISGDGRVAERFRGTGKEEGGGQVAHNVVPIGLGALTVIDATPSLTTGPKAGNPPPTTTTTSTSKYIVNTSLLYLTHDSLYITCDRAQGVSISQQSGGGAEVVPLGPRPTTASTHHSSATTDRASSPTTGGHGGHTASAPGDAHTTSSSSSSSASASASPDSCVYVTQARDGCVGGNRREVYVMAEDTQAPLSAQRDRRGVFQVRLLVKDGMVVEDKDGLEGAVLSPRPPLGAPLDREWVLGRAQVSLSTSRALRLGAAALRVGKGAVAVGGAPSSTATATATQNLPGGLKATAPVEHADYGDESAAANLVDLLAIQAEKAWRYTESKYLGHERLKAAQGGAVLAERRRTTQAPGLAMAQHKKDIRASEANAFSSFLAAFPPQDDIDALVEATRRPPSPRKAPTAASKPEEVCTLCGPLPPSYDGGSISQSPTLGTSRRYYPANLCAAMHDITRLVAARKSRKGGVVVAALQGGGAGAGPPGTVRIPNTNIHVPQSLMNWENKPRGAKAGKTLRIANFDALLSAQDQGIGLKELVAEAAEINRTMRRAAEESDEESDSGDEDVTL